MVVSTVQVRNMRYVVGRSRQQAAAGQLIISGFYLFNNLKVIRYFPGNPPPDVRLLRDVTCTTSSHMLHPGARDPVERHFGLR